jgi:hypothetical protein
MPRTIGERKWKDRRSGKDRRKIVCDVDVERRFCTRRSGVDRRNIHKITWEK